MLGQFLFVGQKIGLERAILFGSGATGPGACDGTDRHLLAKDAHEDFWAGPDHLKAAEVEIEHEGRRVGAPQAAIEREGRLAKCLRPALAWHDLKDVACANVVLGLFHGGLVTFAGKV